MLTWILVLLIQVACTTTQATTTETYPYQPHLQQPGSTGEAKFCFVVRTYWGHAGPDGLQHFFASLQAQQVQE